MQRITKYQLLLKVRLRRPEPAPRGPRAGPVVSIGRGPRAGPVMSIGRGTRGLGR